jgi:hypothetical protein
MSDNAGLFFFALLQLPNLLMVCLLTFQDRSAKVEQ